MRNGKLLVPWCMNMWASFLVTLQGSTKTHLIAMIVRWRAVGAASNKTQASDLSFGLDKYKALNRQLQPKIKWEINGGSESEWDPSTGWLSQHEGSWDNFLKGSPCYSCSWCWRLAYHKKTSYYWQVEGKCWHSFQPVFYSRSQCYWYYCSIACQWSAYHHIYSWGTQICHKITEAE